MQDDQDDFDFEDLAASVPEDEALETIAGLVRRQIELEDEVAALTEALSDAERNLREVSMVLLPDALRSVGLSALDMHDGLRVRIKHSVKASIPQAKREAAFMWLRKHGFGALIKPRTVEEHVHPQTLMAFAREQLEAGKPLPEEHFSVYEFDQTKIVRP